MLENSRLERLGDKMSDCALCGSKNDDTAKFCISCGAPLEVIEKVTDAEVIAPVNDVMQDEIQINYGADNSANDNTYAGTYSNTVDLQQPQYYSNPVQTVKKPTNGNIGFSIASMVLGILSLICCCFSLFSVVIGIVGVILGVVAIVNKYDGKGMAIAGIITGGLGIFIGAIALIISGTNSYNDYLDELRREFL